MRGSGVVLDEGAAIGSVAYAFWELANTVGCEKRGHMLGAPAVLQKIAQSNRAELRLTSGHQVPIVVNKVGSDGAGFIIVLGRDGELP